MRDAVGGRPVGFPLLVFFEWCCDARGVLVGWVGFLSGVGWYRLLDGGWGSGKVVGLPRKGPVLGFPVVCVRFLRTQQRVKSQCLIAGRPPFLFGGGGGL